MTVLTIVLWAILIAVTLVFEFITVGHVGCCFTLGGVVALILAICRVSIYWQIPVFVGVVLLTVIAVRPFLKKWWDKKPTEKPTEDSTEKLTA